MGRVRAEEAGKEEGRKEGREELTVKKTEPHTRGEEQQGNTRNSSGLGPT